MIHFDEHIACTYFSKWVGSTTTYTTMGTQNLFFIMILGSKGTDRQDIGRSPLFVGDCWGKDYYRAPECYIPSSQTCPGLRVQDWRGKHVGGKHLIEAVDVLMNLRHISRFPCVDCGLLSVALCFWIKYLFWMWYIYIIYIYTYYTHRTDIVALLLLCNRATLEDGSIHSFMFFFLNPFLSHQNPTSQSHSQVISNSNMPNQRGFMGLVDDGIRICYLYMHLPHKSTIHVGGKHII